MRSRGSICRLHMTPNDLRAWQVHIGYSYAQACAALGVASSTYARMLSSEAKIDRRTALACAALAAGIEPWGAASAPQAAAAADGRPALP